MTTKLPVYRLVVLGDGGVGKTCLVIQMVMSHYTEIYDPTIEDSYRKQVEIDEQPCVMDILDTAGQEEYVALREQFMRMCEAAMLVYSISSRDSFEKIEAFHRQIQRVKAAHTLAPTPDMTIAELSQTDWGHEGPKSAQTHSTDYISVPVALVGNKSDRYHEREVSTAEGHALARKLGCAFYETSAKNCVSVHKAFYDLVREVRRERLRIRPHPQPVSQQLPVSQGDNSSRLTVGTQLARRFRFLAPVYRWLTGVKLDLATEYRHNPDHQLALNKVLIEAARLADLRGIKKCLLNGAQINAQPGPDGSALHASVALGHLKIVQFLLEKGAAVNMKGPRQLTALHMASAEGHEGIVKMLLKEGADVRTTLDSHGTALHSAASRGQVGVVRILIEHGAAVDAKGGQYGNALQAAAVVGNTDLVNVLLDAGAYVDVRGERNCTPLQAACNAGHVNVVRLLLERGANVNAAGGEYGTAVQAANTNSKADVFNMLMFYGADVTALARTTPQNSDLQVSRQGARELDTEISGISTPPYISEDGEQVEPQRTPVSTTKSAEWRGIQWRGFHSPEHGKSHSVAGSAHTKTASVRSLPDYLVSAGNISRTSTMQISSLGNATSFSELTKAGLSTIPVAESSVVTRPLPGAQPSLSRTDYTIGIICPMAVELTPIEAMLDQHHQQLPTSRDQNAYTLGQIGEHNVVIAVMPEIGNNMAALVATQLVNDFPSLRFALLVGIGGGVPGLRDVRLGDVVVSKASGTFGGVIQYDMGKHHPNGVFEKTGFSRKPPAIVSATVEQLRSRHHREGTKIPNYLSEMALKYPRLGPDVRYPGIELDVLFKETYVHEAGDTCADCSPADVVSRVPRDNTDPIVHYGIIGSANAVVRDSATRRKLQQDSGIICVEMEAAGLVETISCLVIRGICDYADSHKNKVWQRYAAATAAAYMKELLLMFPPREVAKETLGFNS